MKWHAVWQAVLAAVSMFTAGGVLADYIGQRQAGLMGLLVASLQAGTAGYYASQNRTVVSAPTLLTPPPQK